MEIDYLPPTTATIIWLHGLGADGRDFEELPQWLGRPGTRYVLPDAPVRAVTLNGGARARAWFDIYGLAPRSPIDWAGLHQARATLADLIATERDRHERPIVLGGFSQGGALALYTGLSLPLELSAIVGLSTYLPLVENDSWILPNPPPVFLAHGADDNVVPLTTAERTAERLKSGGVQPVWSTWPMGHTLHPEELALLARWLGTILPPSADNSAAGELPA